MDYNKMIKRAVIAGYTAINPATHYGWTGACPGANVDVRRLSELCGKAGIDVANMLNQDATKQRFFESCREATRHMIANDLFVMAISGHGGQMPDLNGDEPDGKDEYTVMWDINTTDDEFWSLLCEIPKHVRVLCIFDQCTSQTMARFVPDAVVGKPLSALRASVITLSGCADAKYAYGSINGGEFTGQLYKAYTTPLTYQQWFNNAAYNMPVNQTPKWNEYGHVLEVEYFRNQQALS
jgi:hypothetical protein